MALVHDEYGHFDVLVTPADILDAIAGAFLSEDTDRTRYPARTVLADRGFDAGR